MKSGEVIPEQLDCQSALQLMIENPLLIRRPLMQVGERCEVGFEIDEIEDWIGLSPVSDRSKAIHKNLKSQDLQTCPHTDRQTGSLS